VTPCSDVDARLTSRAALRDSKDLRAAIAPERGLLQNASRAAEMKEGTTASRALRYCPHWRFDGDCTLFGATVDRLLCRVGLSDGADNSGLAACPVL